MKVKEKSYLIYIRRTEKEIIITAEVTLETDCLGEAEKFIGDKPSFIPANSNVPYGLAVIFDPNYHVKELTPTLVTPSGLLIHGNCVLCRYSGKDILGIVLAVLLSRY